MSSSNLDLPQLRPKCRPVLGPVLDDVQYYLKRSMLRRLCCCEALIFLCCHHYLSLSSFIIHVQCSMTMHINNKPLFLTVVFLTQGISSRAFTGACQSHRRSSGTCNGNGNVAQLDATVCLSAVSVDDIDNLPVGLLRNIDVTQDEYYALDLGVNSLGDLAWLQQPGLAWEAADKDAAALGLSGAAEYIGNVQDAMLSNCSPRLEFSKIEKICTNSSVLLPPLPVLPYFWEGRVSARVCS
jgi:hypothetical protein